MIHPVLYMLHVMSQAELSRMEKLGVTSQVDEPTPWCAGMVVVPKANGSVHICVDLKALNESVMRKITHFLRWMRL